MGDTDVLLERVNAASVALWGLGSELAVLHARRAKPYVLYI